VFMCGNVRTCTNTEPAQMADQHITLYWFNERHSLEPAVQAYPRLPQRTP